jgi:SNF2 family DNA or RNA helicase
MTELYTMQRYLQPHRLKEYGLEHFDSWAAMFGEVVTNVEVNTTGTGYRTKERFSKFVNIPELISMFREVADVKTIKHLPEIQKARPELKGGTQIIVSVEPSKILKEFIKDLVHRLDNLPTDKSIDNHLKVFNDGRNSALDLRLVGINYDDPNSKLNKCIENVFRIWKETSDRKATQLVFSDLGTPGKKKSIIKLDIYQDIKQKLVQMGVPAKEVAFIHDAKNDEAKAVMFDKVRRGEIRVLIGSTAKMGAGMNVQDRLFAEHHLDAPYRPADVEQRDGRELRPGNLHKEWGIPVEIYRYVTKDSFDAYNWQIIETKANYISQIMNGDSNVREMEDVDEAAMSAAEMKAAAAGNQQPSRHKGRR